MKLEWESFKDSRTLAAIGIAVFGAVTYFSGKYDDIRLLEYWALILLCASSQIYILRNFNSKIAKPIIIVVFLCSALFSYLIFHRQNLRYENYEISWDIAYNNEFTTDSRHFIQIGLCLVNPNKFPIYVKFPTISANIEKISGSYANIDPDRVYELGIFSASSSEFSDPILIENLSGDELNGILHASIKYGREKENLNKELNILANVTYLKGARGGVMGAFVDPTIGAVPNNYNLVRTPRKSDCRPF